MTARVPYTRDALARIRLAAQQNMTLEQYAPEIGWSVGMLRNVCQRNAIEMISNPATAPKQKTVPAAIPVKATDCDTVGDLDFDYGGGLVWCTGHFAHLTQHAIVILSLLAQRAPRAMSSESITKQLFGPMTASHHDAQMVAALACLDGNLGLLRRRLVRLEGGKFFALTKVTAAEAAE